jgi:FkbM family methyltransferase
MWDHAAPPRMRAPSDYLRNLPQAHRYLCWFAKVVVLFRRPFRFLLHYLRRTSPSDGVVEMRDGTRIYLSGHPHDVITLFVILVREDYGRFPPGGTVVDIGANLGAFALHAARRGARTVLAYEPNGAAFRCLQRNVEVNGLSGSVRARQLAVSAVAGQDVRFPLAPSVYNRIAGEGEVGEFETVRTTSLAEILARDAAQGIDLLKLDCEGAEYDILFSAAPSDISRVREIRMEYHSGRDTELKTYLRNAGFEITSFRPDSPSTGNIWARRKGTPDLS